MITLSSDTVINDVGETMCSDIESILDLLDDLSTADPDEGITDDQIRSMAQGFVAGLNEEAGVSYSADDGAVIVETFLRVYCPEVF